MTYKRFMILVLILLAAIYFGVMGIWAHLAFSAEKFTFHGVIGDSITVEWSPNPEPDLAEYRLYYQGPGQSGIKVIAAPDTSLRLRVALGYYYERVQFWLTAVDASGNQSAASDTISTILCKERRMIGDRDGNGRVNVIDKAWYLISAGTKRGDLLYSEREDFNGDGAVNVLDKSYLNLNAGK